MADPHAAAPELKRLQWLVRGAFLWALLIVGRLAYLQMVVKQEFTQIADKQQEEGFPIQPPRGALTDREGNPLAVSVPAWSVILNPYKLTDAEVPVAVNLLSRSLKLEKNKLQTDVTAARQNRRQFLRVKRRIEKREYEELRSWIEAENRKTRSMKDNVDWMSFEQESWRVYPHGELGAAVIGSVDHEENGMSGVEQTLQNDLKGQSGYVRMLVDSHKNPVDSLERKEPRPGKDVALTLHSQLQFYCDRQLAAAMTESGSTSGTIVVMNPHNGEVYAMSAFPSFDPNSRPRNQAELSRRIHRAAGSALDGGSVMKMFVIAAALEHTRLRANTPIDCGNGLFHYADKVIHDTHAYGVMPMEKVLWKSSNVGAIRIGLELGKQNLWSALRDFGFGQRTGIALPGESAGLLKPLEKWKNSSLYYVSIGHEIGVTTMQLAQACSVIANGGFRVRPKLVLSKQSESGQVELEPESPKVRVMKASTTVDMRNMSEGVVLYGTGTKAKVKGFTVGGKTGTAQLIDPKTGHYVKLYSSSFMGYAPLASPKVVVVVSLNGGKRFGGDAAAPVFSKVTTAALNMLGEQADIPQEAAPSDQKNPGAAEELLLAGAAAHPASAPAAAAAAAAAAPAAVEAKPNEVITGPTVPDFNGMDKRAVVRASAELGMPVEMSGAGIVRAQSPPAGSALALGATVRLRFAR